MTEHGTTPERAALSPSELASLSIVDIQTMTFRHTSHVGRDTKGHGHPAQAHEATKTITRVRTSAGVDGYCVGGSPETAAVAMRMVGDMNPLSREAIWIELLQAQRLERRAMDDRNLAAIDCALWDFAGRLTGMPIHRLLGSSRDSVPAYASSMCGDDIAGGLDSPEAYADFAAACQAQGYPAFKLHTWMAPYGPDLDRDIAACQAQGYPAFKLHTWMAPYGPDLDRDIAACQAVRERVGPDMKLMVDPHHDYTREEALRLGRALEALGYYWMEEPMNEHSISSYIWLTEQLDLTIVGPETAEGQMYTRAEWIVRGAADVSRVGVWDVGGITPAMKVVHLCESFRMRCEVHGGGAANLQVLGAMGIPGEFYEKGLLHPHVDFEAESPWLKTPIDLIDERGHVAIPQGPGLGEDLDWDFIRDNMVSDWA